MRQKKAALPGNCDIESFIERIHKIALRMIKNLPPSMHVDDLVSYGVLGLCDAWSRFEPSRGVRFWTYAEPRVWGAMGDGIRQWHLVHHRNKSGIRIVSECHLEREPDISPEEVSDKQNMEQALCLMWGAVDELPGNQGQIIRMEFRHGLSILQICDIVGLPRSTVYEIRRKALAALQRSLSDKTHESSSCSGREVPPAIFGEKG